MGSGRDADQHQWSMMVETDGSASDHHRPGRTHSLPLFAAQHLDAAWVRYEQWSGGRAHSLQCILVLALLASNVGLWLASTTRSISFSNPGPVPCTPDEAGAIFFDSRRRRFVGCDGAHWSSLAFCCAPSQPDPPLLSRDRNRDGGSLRLQWVAPQANGSPVSTYSVTVLGTAAPYNTSRPTEVCRGWALWCTVQHIDPKESYSFVLRAHAAGGDSEPSLPARLQPAPTPVSFEAVDDGDCTFGARDELLLRLSGPTDRGGHHVGEQLSPEALRAMLQLVGPGDAGWVGSASSSPSPSPSSSLSWPPPPPPSGRRQLTGILRLDQYHASADTTAVAERRSELDALVASLNGSWASSDTLRLTLGSADAPPPVEAYTQRLALQLLPEGGISAPAPAVSLPASGASPMLALPGCFAEGFEGERLARWAVEATDPASYHFGLDAGVVHSGRHALRMQGGRGGQYDGLVSLLPPRSRPTSVSFWLRADTAANVGYLALGGNTATSPTAVFFHLKPDGTAGLLASDGGWHAGRYRLEQWLHVTVWLDWARRTAQLWLDGALVADEVAFVTRGVESIEALHLFNSDLGTVWVDDLTVALPPRLQK